MNFILPCLSLIFFVPSASWAVTHRTISPAQLQFDLSVEHENIRPTSQTNEQTPAGFQWSFDTSTTRPTSTVVRRNFASFSSTVSIEFSDRSRSALGTLHCPEFSTLQTQAPFTRRCSVVISRNEFSNLAQSHLFEIGWLRAPQNIRLERTSVLINGDTPDAGCSHPILFTDFHGTIDVSDERSQACVNQALERLTQAGVTILVVSNGSTAVYSERPEIFGLSPRIAALPIDAPSSFSGSTGVEKAQRIRSNLNTTAACVLGIAGETPEKEGDAANILRIPYLAANQVDAPEEVLRRTIRNVPACQRLSTQGTQQLENVSASTHETSRPSIEYLVPYTNRRGTPSCEASHTLVTLQVPLYIPTPTGRLRPSIDMSRFTVGSFYSHNWCELGDHLMQVLTARRNASRP